MGTFSSKKASMEERYESEKKYDIFRSFVEEDQLNQKMESNGEVIGLCNYIKDSLDKWKEQQIKIVVSGHAGSGKSSLINALRNMKTSDEGAADVGVTETTKESKVYTYPGNKYVTISDLPGYGTKHFPNDSYFKDTKISTYDVEIVVISERFFKDDGSVANQFLQKRRNVLFVRTKIDQDVTNEKGDRGNDFNESYCLEKIRKEITENLSKESVDDDVFLVSSKSRDLYDFEKLEKRLQEMTNVRGRAISVILKERVTSAIKIKQMNQKKGFGKQIWISVITGFLPIPFLETAGRIMSITAIRNTLFEKFSLDEKTLEKFCEEVHPNKNVYETKSKLKEQLESYKKSCNYSECPFETALEKFVFQQNSKYLLPVLGSFISAYKSYRITDTYLIEMCKMFANDELKLVEMRLKKLEEELKLL